MNIKDIFGNVGSILLAVGIFGAIVTVVVASFMADVTLGFLVAFVATAVVGYLAIQVSE